MAEWQTYELADFLMFSPETYYRLIELYNIAVWPWHLATAISFTAVVVMLLRGMTRPAFLLLALFWAVVAWAFFYGRFATILWAAPHFAAAFIMQALLLLIAISRPGWITFEGAGRMQLYPGISMIGFALVGHPLISHLSGRGWSGVEGIGLMPDPTVTATFGLLLLAVRSPWWLYAVPTLWCMVTGMMLYAMEAPDFWLMPLIAIMTLAIKRTLKPRFIK